MGMRAQLSGETDTTDINTLEKTSENKLSEPKQIQRSFINTLQTLNIENIQKKCPSARPQSIDEHMRVVDAGKFETRQNGGRQAHKDE